MLLTAEPSPLPHSHPPVCGLAMLPVRCRELREVSPGDKRCLGPLYPRDTHAFSEASLTHQALLRFGLEFVCCVWSVGTCVQTLAEDSESLSRRHLSHPLCLLLPL